MNKLTTTVTGISLPIKLLEKIDRDRGDINRSRFIQRRLEEYYRRIEENKNNL